MAPSLNAPNLELIAIQLASIQENYTRKSFWERLRFRFENEFVGKSLKDKAVFVKYAFWSVLEKLLKRVRRLQAARIQVPADAPGLKIAAVCNGGMGDLIIYSAFLDRLYREFGRPVIHAVVHPLRVNEAAFVFCNSPSVRLVTPNADLNHETTPYDVIIKLGDFMSYEFIRERSGASVDSNVVRRMIDAQKGQQPYRGFIDSQPCFDGLFASYAAQSGLGRLGLLGWFAQIDFSQQHQLHLSCDPNAYQYLATHHRLANTPYITIHNGWDNVAHRHAETVTKAWPEQHYEAFVEAFKRQFPEVLVVQLGAQTSKRIANVDLCLVNETSLHEAAWVLKNSLLHVDGDSGLVHMARALHTKSLVLFGPTNAEFFHYHTNDKLVAGSCTNCWWSTQDWMRSCPRGLTKPECMSSISPETVLESVSQSLNDIAFWDFDLTAAHVPEGAQIGDRLRGFQSWAAAQVAGAPGTSAEKMRDAPRIAWLCDPRASQSMEPAIGAPCGDFGSNSTDVSVFRLLFGPSTPGTDSDQDFGSIYNVPAENSVFSVVVIPDFPETIRFPGFALKEAARILEENGLLIVSLAAGSEQASEERWNQFGADLERLGASCPTIGASGAFLALRKRRASRRIPQRASQTLPIMHEQHGEAPRRHPERGHVPANELVNC